MRIIAFASRKGGSGKTTITAQLAVQAGRAQRAGYDAEVWDEATAARVF